MSERLLGIEIGSCMIKMIEVSRKAEALLVHRFSLIETPRECLKNGLMINQEKLKEVLSKEMQKRGYRAHKVVSVVQSESILTRTVTVKAQSDQLMPQVLAKTVHAYLPIEPYKYQIDYRVHKRFIEEGEEKMEILIVAAPNQLIFPMITLFKSLKKTPLLIITPSEALGYVLGEKRQLIYDVEPCTMVLDIGGYFSNVTLLVNYRPTLTRTIAYGMATLNERLEREKLSLQQVGQSLQFDPFIEEQIEHHIIAEVKRMLQFYYSSFHENKIEKLYLIGGGTRLNGVRTYIRDTLNVPTEKLTTFSNVLEMPLVEFEDYRGFFVNLLGAMNAV